VQKGRENKKTGIYHLLFVYSKKIYNANIILYKKQFLPRQICWMMIYSNEIEIHKKAQIMLDFLMNYLIKVVLKDITFRIIIILRSAKPTRFNVPINSLKNKKNTEAIVSHNY
jgi:alpha-N-acetylglucosamine transferase